MSHRLGGPVASVLGVIRGIETPAHGANPGRLVVLTQRNLYVMKGGMMFASAPAKMLLREPIESVSLSFDEGPSTITRLDEILLRHVPRQLLTVGDHMIQFYLQRRRAVEMMDAVSGAQGSATASSTSRPS